MKLTDIKFTSWLGVVSFIGFLTILVDSSTGVDIGPYAASLLFIIIGLALFIAGGARFFVYFKNGLTADEVNRVVTVAVGFASVVTGILTAPFFNLNFTVLNGIKAIIASIAMMVIVLEMFSKK